MARRFIVDGEVNSDGKIEITGEEAKHIFVLRHNAGDIIEINDKECEIISISKHSVVCNVIGDAKVKGVPNIKITLYQALLKSDKMEYVIQKAVELGVSQIIPFYSTNVVVKYDEKDKVKKIERYNKISVEASKQCGRSDIVKVGEICTFNNMVSTLKNYDKSIIAYENEEIGLKDVLRNQKELKNIAIIVGAEGGFDKQEVEEVMGNGCVSVSLGSRILRAETASLNLISILMYELD